MKTASPGQSSQSPVLSYADFQKATSIEDLSDAYSKKGVSFDDTSKLLRQIADDFRAALPEGLKANIEKPNGTIEPTTVVIDKSSFRIYGVTHKKSDEYPTFFDEMYKHMVGSGGLIFAEQGLPLMLFEQVSSEFSEKGAMIEINDHLLGDGKSEIGLGIRNYSGKLHSGEDKIRNNKAPEKPKQSSIRSRISNVINFIDSGTPMISDILGTKRGEKLCDDISRRLGIDMNDMSVIQRLDKIDQDNHSGLYSKVITLDPTLFFSSGNNFLPEYVDLELKNKQGKLLSSIEKRSAYMAEFMREWLSHEPKGTNCNIVCGAFHAAQIVYFLQNGSPTEIVEEAKMQVAMAKDNTSLYKASSGLELMKTTFHFAVGSQIGAFLKEIGSIPGVAWGVNRLMDKLKIPKRDDYSSTIPE